MEPWWPSLRPTGDFADAPVLSCVSVSERFDVQAELGRGGMARVFKAVERATGRVVALKRLERTEPAERWFRTAVLFEREYRTLSQLAHPRVVEAYEYGVDAQGPYYTLELLDGGDLHEVAPVAWRDACAIARDICSALSLVHSRRLVHRDISPRNVRRTQSGAAKLIDFGAVAPMGPSKWLVGTPPCCAPESLQLQALDARTDLFALGATLYFALTGRHAFAARSFSEVLSAWQHGFALPSEYVADIPNALDVLVAELLQLEPDARPANAAEVIERLCAIDGQSQLEHLQVAQAYLAMPPVIGAAEPLAQLRAAIARATTRERASVCVIEGESGVGRSRMLDTCLLDAALRGAVCARADAEDAAAGDYGVLRALVRQLHGRMPELSEACAGHDELAPLLFDAAESQPELRDSRALRPKLQAALQSWLTDLARERVLVLAVDDCDRADEPSVSALAFSAWQLPPGTCFVLSAQTGARWLAPAAKTLMLEQAERVTLDRFSQEDSERLLSALFDAAPNVGPLAHRLHELACGKPRDLMRLAQHLVERGIVQYRDGAWTLPARLDEVELPSSMAQALRARVDTLSAPTRALGAALALCPDDGFDRHECALLMNMDKAQLSELLEQLMAADMARQIGAEQYRLTHAQWVAPLREQLAPEALPQLARRLARVFMLRNQSFRAAQHLFLAGQDDAGLDVLVDHSHVSQETTAASAEEFLRYARSLPANWFETFEHALRLCDTLNRPARDRYCLLGRLTGIMPAFGVIGRAHFSALFDLLEARCGYHDYLRLDPELDPAQRARQALSLAQARYDGASEGERWLDPVMALRMLLRSLVSASSLVALGIDIPFLRSWPNVGPFAEIVPGATVIARLVDGMAARYGGWLEQSRDIYLELLELTGADRAALDASHVDIMRLAMMNGLAVTEACMGMHSSLTWSERTAVHPAYRLNSLHACMLYHLYVGDLERVEDCKQRLERLRVQTLQLYETSNLLWEISAYVICEDLTMLRRSVEAVGSLAERHTAWRPVQHYLRAESYRVKRDPSRALPEAEAAVSGAEPGSHPLWAAMAASHVRVLLALDRLSEALRACEDYGRRAQAAKLGFMAEELWLALALCQARLQQPTAANTCDAVLDRLAAQGVGGIRLGLAHEARARVALALEDRAGFDRHFLWAKEAYGCKHPALNAKIRRLAQLAEVRTSANHGPLALLGTHSTDSALQLVGTLQACHGNEARGRLTLTILCRQAGVRDGHLYLLHDQGLKLTASVGAGSPPLELLSHAQAYLAAHVKDAVRTLTGDESGEIKPSWPSELVDYRPLLLSHDHASGLAVTGVVVLARCASGFVYPGRVIAALSRSWAETGQVSTIIADEA